MQAHHAHPERASQVHSRSSARQMGIHMRDSCRDYCTVLSWFPTSRPALAYCEGVGRRHYVGTPIAIILQLRKILDLVLVTTAYYCDLRSLYL